MTEAPDPRAQARDFLRTRRAKVTPAMVDLPQYGTHRRVPGLRREEVALLAGVSVDYYVRMEKGNLAGVSDQVLEAVARALLLGEAERLHLFDLARAANAGRAPRGSAPGSRPEVRLPVQLVLDSMTTSAAFVSNGRLDVIGSNALLRELYSPVFASPTTGRADLPNIARFQLLDPHARQFFPEWDEAVRTTVEILRMSAGRYPFDRRLQDLIGELTTRSDEFARAWADHDVRLHSRGVKSVHHPEVGEIELWFEALRFDGDDDLSLTVYTTEPGSPSADRFRILGALAAARTDKARGTDPAV